MEKVESVLVRYIFPICKADGFIRLPNLGTKITCENGHGMRVTKILKTKVILFQLERQALFNAVNMEGSLDIYSDKQKRSVSQMADILLEKVE